MSEFDRLFHASSRQTIQNDDTSLTLSMPAMDMGKWSIAPQPDEMRHPQIRPLFQFDPRIVREVILYIASKLRQPSFHQISKILYFADKLHLIRYGRLITGDRYIAMEYGPVPSNVYDMLKAARTINGPIADELTPGFSVQDERIVIPHRAADLDWISDSERECLDETIAQFGSLSFRQLTEVSHDTAWQSTERNREIALEAILTSIGNPESLLEHLRDPNP